MTIDQRPAPAGTTDLLRAVLSLAADLDLPSLLERFVDASTELTGARYGAINILDEHGVSLTFVQSGLDDSIVAQLANSPHSIGVLGQIPAHGVLRLEDLTDHPAFQGFPSNHPPMGSFLGAAVRVREEVFGYLYLSEKIGGFNDDDEAVVTALGAAVAVAIQNATLYADADRRHTRLRNAAWTLVDRTAARLCTAGRFALRGDRDERKRFRRVAQKRRRKGAKTS